MTATTKRRQRQEAAEPQGVDLVQIDARLSGRFALIWWVDRETFFFFGI